ncbi:hypothetical protein O181_123637 [Austropuccinia psidii MF-1]|uniref:Uncharacterized protein n=1 Tax=Austropuccinia psidii MF-1 TaxID=1389203 RepID=A0A9Q3KQF2_9BASI|nr:hypothetical protein [Austropuccinia psidii MF-1]
MDTCAARAASNARLSFLIPVMSAPPTLYKWIKAPSRKSVCPDLDNANLTSSPLDTMPYLNVETHGQIVGMHQAGLRFQAIFNLAGMPLTTVYGTMKKYKHFGTVQTEKETGRPPMMTAQDFQELKCEIHKLGDLDRQVPIRAQEKGQLGLCLAETSREVATGKPCGQPSTQLPDAHGMGCFLRSNASTVGLSQWLNDIGRDGAASLSTKPGWSRPPGYVVTNTSY